jgi:3-hydroxybutyryl-CoA dehydrogenase
MGEIKKIGIIGAGTMGGGIAQVAAESGCKVIVKDVDERAVRTGLERIRARLERRVSEGKLASEEKDAILSHIECTVRPEDFRDADLVLEAAVEKEEIKKRLF